MPADSKAPKASPPKCDVPGCGMVAVACTDGTETDSQGLGRPAIKNLNLCTRHPNWAHSEDAQRFVLMSDDYKARK